MNILKYISFFAIVIVLASCSATKRLPPGETLYVGSNIKLDAVDAKDKKAAKDMDAELQALLRPLPNTKVLGLRYKLFFYNLAGIPKKNKGIKYWIRNKLGEPPVLGSQVNIEKNSSILQNRLENRGFFKSAVTADTVVKSKKLTVNYTAKLNQRYTIREVRYPTDSSDISKAIRRGIRGSRLKPGAPYDLDMAKDERLRIDTRLKNRGFFYFADDYLWVNVDSTVGNHQVDMVVQVKENTPDESKNIYKINDVVVYADYNLASDTGSVKDAKTFDGYKIIDPYNKYKPQIFSRTLVFKPGDIYNRNDHNLALNRLVDLGVFKFVKVRFEEPDTVKGNLLNAFYYLTPVKKKSIRAELSALTKSNNSNGTELTLSWRNRNFLKGAELFTVSIFGGIEKQVSGNQRNISTLRLGGDLNLYVPRIISPFKFKTASGFVPKTRFNLGYELFQRNTQYTLNSFKGSYGYVFRDDITKEHQLNVLAINYVKPINITPDFQRGLDTNITLRRSIERQFIIGSNYNYNINTNAKPNRKQHNFYFNGNIDLSGNLLGLITGADVDKGKEKLILNTPFSQYAKVETEVRHYFKLGTKPENMLVSRLIAGLGYAYGNSQTVPFIKQFFIGGTNSIRAFRARSLGPGKYYAGNAQSVGFLPDQPGDVKIEANTELRAKLFSIVQGAIFVDAGNIWTRRDDTSRPGSKFTSKFLNDFAVGTGAGLRFDVKFLVLRLDVAFPIRKPYLPGGPAWVIDQVDFGNRQWRRENMVYNLAIGYPF